MVFILCSSLHKVSQRAAVDSVFETQANGAADSCSAPNLALYVAELARYGRPVWLTELACPLGPGAANEGAQAAYMAAALGVLDHERAVERCAGPHAPKRFSTFVPALADISRLAPIVCHACHGHRRARCVLGCDLYQGAPRTVKLGHYMLASTVAATLPTYASTCTLWVNCELLQI